MSFWGVGEFVETVILKKNFLTNRCIRKSNLKVKESGEKKPCNEACYQRSFLMHLRSQSVWGDKMSCFMKTSN